MSVLRPVAASDPDLSVVISTIPAYDHAGVVEHLREQEFDRPYELLIVEDGELDRSAARNRGLREAAADVVALTDDDCEPPPDWLGAVWRTFESVDDLVCLEGAVYGGARYRGRRHYVGCNLAVDREAALDVGGFDSEFAGWREDTEFGWRMERDAEGACAFDPRVRVRHPTVPRSPLDPRRERMLRAAYPERYDAILDRHPLQRVYRAARAAGVTPVVHRQLNRVRRVGRAAAALLE